MYVWWYNFYDFWLATESLPVQTQTIMLHAALGNLFMHLNLWTVWSYSYKFVIWNLV